MKYHASNRRIVIATILSFLILSASFQPLGAAFGKSESGNRDVAITKYDCSELRMLDNKAIIVYITKTGKKYHRGNCRYLKDSKIAVTLAQAKRRGYTPCSVCKPPR